MNGLKNTVVVSGIGIITPLKPFMKADDFWDALCSGEDAIKRASPPMLDLGRTWLMAGIEPSCFPSGLCAENKFQCIAEEALAMAIKDANLPEYRNAGISVGTVLGNVLAKERRLIEGRKQKGNDNGGSDTESLSFIASHLAAKHALNGPNITVSTACASGTDAIGIAARKIMAGKADIMFAGGVDVLSDFALLGFHSLQALTEEKVRPFDKKRSGLALGEGAAFVVLESEKHASRRGAKVYGKVIGYASRSDANHLTGPHREGRGLADAICQAMAEENLKQTGVDYINAHGTGTLYNDLMETKAIKKVFGKRAYGIPISSTKSMLGHAFGASGAIESICCLLAIKNNVVPPTINFSENDPACDLDYVPNISRRQKVSIAMSLSAGFGGQNAAILFSEP